MIRNDHHQPKVVNAYYRVLAFVSQDRIASHPTTVLVVSANWILSRRVRRGRDAVGCVVGCRGRVGRVLRRHHLSTR